MLNHVEAFYADKDSKVSSSDEDFPSSKSSVSSTSSDDTTTPTAAPEKVNKGKKREKTVKRQSLDALRAIQLFATTTGTNFNTSDQHHREQHT